MNYFETRHGTNQTSLHHLYKAIGLLRSIMQRVVGGSALVLLAACSDGSDSAANYSVVSHHHAVGTISLTLIDTSRPTAAHGPIPEAPSRTIETTLVYPAEGMPGGAAQPDVLANRAGAPFPLVVIAHGLGGTVGGLLPLAEAWATRGYVVALPRFPLTNLTTPGGPAGEDVQNQPADVSFVIDQVLAESTMPGQYLSNAVDPNKIAVSGHSNGGITSYGLVAHSCCRDRRIDAALILAGVASPFAGGEYDLQDTPPILVVHGVDDVLLIYNQAVRTYNELLPPKGLLTLEASNHTSFFRSDDPAFDVFAQSTVDFLDHVLRGNSDALARLPEYQIPGIATMHWAPDEASNIPVETLPEPETNRQASLSADSNLIDGQLITVTWSGFLPGQVVNILQCAGDGTDGAASCNVSGGRILFPNPEGMGSLELEINVGPIGNGVCDSDNPCVVVVNDSGLTDEDAIIRIPITLAN